MQTNKFIENKNIILRDVEVEDTKLEERRFYSIYVNHEVL